MDTSFALTQVCEDRDFSDWHQGCPWCAVWVVMAQTEAVQATVQAARHTLADVLLPRYERQPHVTVAYRGLCAGSNAHDAAPALHTTAEFGADQLRADVQALAQAAQPPFTLELQGVGSFTTVPYLAVSQGMQALQTLHEALVSEPYTPGWRYVPHVTVGQYGQQVPLMDAVAQLQAQGIGQSQLVLAVTELALVRYATHDIAGPLVLEGLWDLTTQRYVPQPGALLAL